MEVVNAGIITIGDELLIGQTIDTNSAYIAQALTEAGLQVQLRISIGDDRKEILDALQLMLQRCDVTIITGGLGPTADDITKPTLCEFFDTKLVSHEDTLKHIERLFARMGRPMGERNAKQAEVPEACTVLPNQRGTAPGMWFTRPGLQGFERIFVSLPGVPYEMKGLVENEVVPRLKALTHAPAIAHRTLLTAGKGESEVADRLAGFEAALPEGISLAYLPDHGILRLRLTARGRMVVADNTLLDNLFEELANQVADILVSKEDKRIASIVQEMLRHKSKTLATAESCTGGHIAHAITQIPGSSDVFCGSIIAYANEVKQNLLSVSPGILEAHGAVSEQTVTAMVKGALQAVGSDYAVATSGIMGPWGGTAEKPVGTVWLAAGSSHHTITRKLQLRYDRKKNIEVATTMALDLLRKLLQQELFEQ